MLLMCESDGAEKNFLNSFNASAAGDSNPNTVYVSNRCTVYLESDWLLSIKPAKAGCVLRLMPGLGGWESSQANSFFKEPFLTLPVSGLPHSGCFL